jgi:dCMP deaminase
LIEISACPLDRYYNYKKKYDNNCDAETFLKLDKSCSSRLISAKLDFTIFNNSSLEEFHSKIDIMLNEYKICERPEWEDYFMDNAEKISNRSNCIKQKVGALIAKENKIVSSGYNGTARKLRNCYEGGCKRCLSEAKQGESMDGCLCIHAEQNAILYVGKKKCEGSTLYTTCFPCEKCAIIIVQSGIKEVVYDREYKSDARNIFSEANIKITKYKKKPTWI